MGGFGFSPRTTIFYILSRESNRKELAPLLYFYLNCLDNIVLVYKYNYLFQIYKNYYPAFPPFLSYSFCSSN